MHPISSTPREQTSDVFVSYATDDFDSKVSAICMALYEVGITSMWMDRLVILPGQSIPERVDEGLRKTRHLLALITPAYFRKPWTKAELSAVKMLSKPTIPVWIDVTHDQVKSFSPTLAAHKAIIFQDDPYQVALAVTEVLIRNKRTHFYKAAPARREAQAFWRVAWLYILHLVEGRNPDDSPNFAQLNSVYPESNSTLQAHVRSQLALETEYVLKLAAALRSTASAQGQEVSTTDLAHIICGDIKRKQQWFPYEPAEQAALERFGMTRWT